MILLGCPDAAQLDTERSRKDAAINAYVERVKHLYPPEQFGDPTDPRSNGGVLKELAELSRLRQRQGADKTRTPDGPFPQKNATGPDGEGTTELARLFDTAPRSSIAEDYRQELLDSSVLIKAALVISLNGK